MASNPTYLTRRQVAALLGVDEGDIRTRDNATLHPIKGRDGSWRYPPEEVAAIMRGLIADDSTAEVNGAVCSAVFEQFKAAKPMTDVVIAVKQPPSVIRSLRAEFDSMTASLTLESTSLQTLGKALGALPKHDAHFIEIVNALVEKTKHEYQRGYADGIAEANDLGEIVDPATGQRRPLAAHEITTAAQMVEKHWQGPPPTKGPST